MAICKPRHWDWNCKWNWNWNWYCKRHYFQFRQVYGPQTYQGGDLGWEDPCHNVTWLFNIVVTWQTINAKSRISQSLATPNLAGWCLRMRRTHSQSYATHWSRGHMTNQRRFISTFTRPMDPKLSRVVLRMNGPHPKSHVTHRSIGHVTNQK